MSDQAEQLRRLVRETVQQDSTLQPGPPMVVVSGSQEDVGTTTIAVQLVKELANQGKRTVLVDANPIRPEVGTKWSELEKLSMQSGRRISREPRGTLVEVLAGSRTVLEGLQPLAEGVRLLAGRWTPESSLDLSDAALDRLLNGLRGLRDSTDIVVVDLGCGMSPWVHRCWLSAQQVLLVTTPKPDAVMGSYATLKLAASDSLHDRVRIVVNRCWEKSQARSVFGRLDHTCRRFLDFSLARFSLVAEYADADRQGKEPSDGKSEACGLMEDFQQSIRLLAAEVISNALVTMRRRMNPTAAATQPHATNGVRKISVSK